MIQKEILTIHSVRQLNNEKKRLLSEIEKDEILISNHWRQLNKSLKPSNIINQIWISKLKSNKIIKPSALIVKATLSAISKML
jgi:hypothetical protein